MGVITALDPTMESPKLQKKLVPLLDNVDQTSVGIRISWSGFDTFMQRFEQLRISLGSPTN